MLRVTADTNIYVSAMNFGGLPERFLRLAEAGSFRLFISDAIIMELGKVLCSEKFDWPEPEIEKSLQQIKRFTRRVHPRHTCHVVTTDPSDNRFLECADAGKINYIVSGDKHLLRLKQHGSVPIVKLAAFMNVLRDKADQ